MPAKKSLAARLLTRVFGRPTAPLRRNPLGRRLEEFEARVVPAAAHVWSRAFGDTNIDTGEAVAADAFGNTYVAGRFQGTANFGLGGIIATGTTDGFVAKYDPVGNLAWVRTYGGAGASVFPSEVALDGAGNVVVAGSHTQTVDFGAGPHNAGVTQDIFLVKLDPNGGDVSARSFSGTGFEFVRSMAIDSAGSVVLTGTFDGTVDFGGGVLTKSGVIGGSTDIFLVKFQAGGTHVFSKRFGDDLSQAGNGVGVDAAGNIVLGGNGGGGADFGGGPLPAGLFLARFDPLGIHLTSRSILASSVADVAVEADGTAYFAGSFGGTVDFGNGQVVTSAGGNQFYLLKTDPSLATVFARGYGDAAHQSVAAVDTDGLGRVALTGGFEGSIDFGNGGVVTSAAGNDLFVAVLDADGTHITSAGYGGADSQGGSDVALDGSRRLYLTGAFRTAINVGGATFNSNGDFDAVVAKYSFAAGTTTAVLAGGNLTLTDVAGQSDAYTVSMSGPDLVVFSPTATFEGAAGTVSPDGHTFTVPLVAVTGLLRLDAAGGDDALTIDLTVGNPVPSGGVQFNGGVGGNDRLVLQGGTVATQTFNFTNSTDGSVVLSAVGTIAYTGLDPITSTLGSAAVILNYSAASEVITLQPFAGDATRTQAVSTAAEAVDFANPTDRLEVNAGGGGGADAVVVDGFGTGGGGFAGTLDVDGEDGFDSVAVNAPLLLTAAGAALVLAAESIALNDGTVTTAGTQTYAGDVGLGATTTMTATAVLFGGDVQLNAFDLTVDQSGDTTVSGTISGAGGLTKAGAGSLTLAGGNTYAGDTTVDGGRLVLTGSVTSDVTVNAAGTLAGTGIVVGNVGGAGTFAPGLSPGTLSIVGNFTPSGTLVFEVNPPAFSGGVDYDQFVVLGAVDLTGATLTFTGTALFENPNQVATLIDNDGAADATVPAASPADGATVVVDGIAYRLFYNGGDGNDVVLIEASAPGTIYVDDDFTASRGQFIADADLGRASQQPAVFGVNAFTTIGEAVAAAPPGSKIVVNGGTYAEAVTLAGPTAAELEVTGDDAAQLVTIDSLATDTFRTVSVRGASVLTVGDGTDTTIDSALGGTGTLVKQGAGTLTLAAASFGFDGEISVTAGTLRVTANDALGSTAGGTTVDVGATLLFDNVSYGSPFFATEAVALGGTVAGAGVADFSGPITLTATAFVSVPAAADVLVLAGAIDEAVAGSGLVKTGAGTAVLGGFFGTTNTYTGTTLVTAGTLQVDAEQLDSDAVVTGGRLAGDFGVVGSLTATGGTIDPGEATNSFTGSLGVDGDVLLTPAVTFHAFLCECGFSDSLVVDGTVTLGGAALTLTADPLFEPAYGDVLVLVDNDGVDPVVGTFAGLPEGAVVTVNGVQLQISYAGDTGNDVVLTRVPDVAVGDATATEGDAGTVLLTFTLTLSAPSSAPVSVDYATADGTASAAAGDYAAAAGTVLFLPGQTTRTVSVVVNGDRTDEADETLFLNLTGPVNARVTDGQGLGTITDDDGAPVVSIAGGSAAEGNAGTAAVTFTVTLSNPSSTPVTVTFATADGTAQAGSDYTAAGGTVTFAPGQTSQTVTVTATGDTTFEPDETFTVTLSNPSGAVIGAAAATGTIVNDDAAPVVSVNDATAAEGNAGAAALTFTVNLSNASSAPVTVGFTTAGVTAQSGVDFTPTAGTLTFAPGQTSQTVTVLVTGDTADEPDETLALNLSAAAGGSIGDGQGVGTILDDDGTPVVSVAGTTVAEGTGGLTPVTFTVTLSNPSGAPVTVTYATADGTATTADGDYTPAAGSLLFAPGETTKTVTVFAAADARFEADETLALTLSAPAGATLGTATATSTLTNDDAPPVVSVAGAAVAEGNAGTTPLTFTVTLSAPSGLPVTVNFATADGTAVAPGDYTAASGTVTFAPGQTSQTITVSVLGDGTFEADETFTLTLSAPSGATIGTGTATGTVVNDDPLPSVSVSDATAAEGNAGPTPVTFTVTLSNPSSTPVTVNFATADGTATVAGGDYAAAAGTVTFAPGVTSQTVTVTVAGDATFEPDEVFSLNLSGAAGGTVGDGQGVGTVVNDDPAPVLTVDSPTVAEGDAGTRAVSFTVTLTPASSGTVTVNYATADGTATAADGDYTPAAGSLVFLPGETSKTVTVFVNGDVTAEPDETFDLVLSNPVNATAGGPGTATVFDDDGAPTVSGTGPAAAEGNTGTTPFVFTLTLSHPSSTPVVVSYQTTDVTATAGADYEPAAGAVTFAPGETTRTVTVLVKGDTVTEADEVFRLSLTAATGATIAPPAVLATVRNDDAPPVAAVGTGPGAESAVRVYDGTTRRLGEPVAILSHAEFAGGVRTATADVNGDGVLDLVAAAGPGSGSTVVVVDGKTGKEIRRFGAYEPSFTGGLYVAAGDLNGDGLAEIVTAPDTGGGARVRVFDGATGDSLADFLAIDDWSFRGGARVAVGDMTNDGVPDLLVGAGFGGGPRAAGFDGRTLRPGTAPVRIFNDFFAFTGSDVATLRNGVYVAVGDVDGDGYGDPIFGGGPGGAPRVRALSGRRLTSDGVTQTPLANFFAGNERGRGGVRLAARDLNQDGRAEIVAGAGDGERSRVTIYSGATVQPEGTPAVFDEFEAFPGSLGGVFVG